MPLHELRRRLLGERRRIMGAELRALESDPRAGARHLAAVLLERRVRRRRESSRLRGLLRLELEYRKRGLSRIAGVDEVGMGPLAGPVVAAAVVLPERARFEGLCDSKLLSRVARERLDREIRAHAISLGIGVATRSEIDRLNIYHAGLLAMRRAVAALAPPPEMVLVDGRRIPELEITQRAVPGGDGEVAAIAAASIVAKVYRDTRMRELDRRYPGYGFAHNAGYGTSEHLRALERQGPTPEHRHSFAPVRAARESQCRTS